MDQESANGNITGYLIFYRNYLHSAESYKVVATEELDIHLHGLEPGTKYAVRIAAYNENGIGIASKILYSATNIAGMLSSMF